MDASMLVGAATSLDGVPRRAFRRATDDDQPALSGPVWDETKNVFARPKLARFVRDEVRAELLAVILRRVVWFEPTETVTDSRDVKDNKYDNKYLELALASGAQTIISSDHDPRCLHPWRGVRIVSAAEYLAL